VFSDRLDGSYSYRNGDGSRYFDNGQGYAEYMAPDGRKYSYAGNEHETTNRDAVTGYQSRFERYHDGYKQEGHHEQYEGKLNAVEGPTGCVEASADDHFGDCPSSKSMEFDDGDGSHLWRSVEFEDREPGCLGERFSGDPISPVMGNFEEGMVDDSGDGDQGYGDDCGLEYEAEGDYGEYDDGGYEDDCYYDWDD